MKRTISTLAAIAVLSFAADAQAQSASAPDPVKIALAHQVLEASGGQKQAEATIGAIFSSTSKLFEGLPADQSNIARLAQRDMQEELVKMIPAIFEMSTTVYAQNLTEKELRDMLAWITSDSGRSISAKSGIMSQQVMAAELPLIKEMMPRIMQKTVDRACEEAKCTADQKQQIAAAVTKGMAARPQ
jgi:hypothetical protein